MSGLETLSEMKEKKSSTPVIMITKSEEEYIMEEAIGSKIADYLIKPVNPNQILLSLKKNLDHSRLVSEKTTLDYQKEFRKIAMEMSMVNSYEEWVELYKKLIFWELELEDIDDQNMFQILESQKAEANSQFGKFIEKNYEDKITIENLASLIGSSRRTFERRFKAATNNTPIEYTQRVRIEAAKKFFEASRKNVSEIMFDVGYTDTKAFRDMFKKITGLTPIEYRNKFARMAYEV
jgi:YesN/AraC family two-component response regulator